MHIQLWHTRILVHGETHDLFPVIGDPQITVRDDKLRLSTKGVKDAVHVHGAIGLNYELIIYVQVTCFYRLGYNERSDEQVRIYQLGIDRCPVYDGLALRRLFLHRGVIGVSQLFGHLVFVRFGNRLDIGDKTIGGLIDRLLLDLLLDRLVSVLYGRGK